MKPVKRLCLGGLCAAALLLSACAKSEPVSMPVVLGTEPGAFDTSIQTSNTKATPTAFIQTDEQEQTITDSGDHPMASVVETTDPAGTNAPGGSIVAADGYSFTTNPKSPSEAKPAASQTSTTTRWTAETTSPRSAPSAATSSTTATPTTTTVKPTAATVPPPTDPWRQPYDLPAIYADCKREIERLGMVWEENLRPDSLNVAWANPDNTVVYSYYPDEYSLQDRILGQMLPFYKNLPYSRKSCRIWMEPMEDSPGEYLIYFLEVL